MTIETMLTAEAKDIKAIVLVCKECGASQGFDPATWNGGLPYGCPNCPGARQWQQTGAAKIVESLTAALRELDKQVELPFQIRLQFDVSTVAGFTRNR